MRILYSKTHYKFGYKAGGSVAHISGVLNALKKHADIEIISNEKFSFLSGFPTTVIKPVSTSWYGEFLYNRRFAKALSQKIREFKPDFVYHRFSGFSYATVKTCKKLAIPIILEFNSSDRWKSKYWATKNLRANITHPFRQFLLSVIEPWTIKNASLITVVSNPLKDKLIKMGISEEKILVNPNGVDIEKFDPNLNLNQHKIRNELDIPDTKTIIGFVGTFGPWHGIPDLTEAIVDINRDLEWRNKVTFVLLGSGGLLYDYIKNRLQKYENVIFTGMIPFEEIQNYLSICHILLSPHGKTADNKEFFGSPTKLFEYMALEKGIVASASGQIADILKQNENAVLYDPGAVKGLVEGIKKLAHNEKFRRKLAQNARQDVVNHYTWDHNVNRLLSFYDKFQKMKTC